LVTHWLIKKETEAGGTADGSGLSGHVRYILVANGN
jgi:hypothetical protein